MLPQPAGDERTDAIVVLTGGTGRIERGFDLIERGLAQRHADLGGRPHGAAGGARRGL